MNQKTGLNDNYESNWVQPRMGDVFSYQCNAHSKYKETDCFLVYYSSKQHLCPRYFCRKWDICSMFFCKWMFVDAIVTKLKISRNTSWSCTDIHTNICCLEMNCSQQFIPITNIHKQKTTCSIKYQSFLCVIRSAWWKTSK